MKKAILTSFVLILFSSYTEGQFYEEPTTPEKRKFLSSVYTELGGPGVVLSINYDLIINESSVFRLGATPTLLSDPNSGNTTELYDDEKFPIVGILSYSKLFGKHSSKLETGLGVVFGDQISYFDKPGPPALFLNFGYRFVSKKTKGTVFKASFTPFIKEEKLIPWAGLSFGYSFN